MTKRMFSSTLLIALIGAIVARGRVNGLVSILVGAALLTQAEFYFLLEKCRCKPLFCVGLSCGLLLMLSATMAAFPATALFLCLLAVSFIAILSQSLNTIKDSLIPTISGIIYTPLMCCYPIHFLTNTCEKSMSDEASIFTIFWIIIVSKCCDIGGMFAGKYFGKHRLAKEISPNKTIEGLGGGIILSNTVALLLTLNFGRFLPANFSPLKSATLALLLGITSVAGDLLESSIKRLAKVKDSGNIIPGIGGIFDLTDSLIFSLPLGVIFMAHCVM